MYSTPSAWALSQGALGIWAATAGVGTTSELLTEPAQRSGAARATAPKHGQSASDTDVVGAVVGAAEAAGNLPSDDSFRSAPVNVSTTTTAAHILRTLITFPPWFGGQLPPITVGAAPSAAHPAASSAHRL